MKVKALHSLCLIIILVTSCTNAQEQDTILVDTVEPITATTSPINTTEVVKTMLAPDEALSQNKNSASTPKYNPSAWTVYLTAEMNITPPINDFPDLRIYDIEEDKKGVMWFASSYGLIRFDGGEWSLVEKEKENKYIHTSYLEIAPDKSIWFTLYNGVYQLKDNIIKSKLTFLDIDKDIYDLAGLEISSDGKVWILLNDKLGYLNESEILILEPENELPVLSTHGLVIDKNGRLYTWGHIAKAKTGSAAYRGMAYGGLSYYEEDKWTIYDQKETYGISSMDETNFFGEPLVLDNQNGIWFYLWREGLFKYEHGQFIRYVQHGNDSYQYLPTSMVFDRHGTLWIGAWDNGNGTQLLKYTPDSECLRYIDNSCVQKDDANTHLSDEQLLSFEEVSALYVDSKNALWIATELGVYVLNLDV